VAAGLAKSRKLAMKVVPFNVMMELTFTCNLRCIHCYNCTQENQDELTLPEICRIMDEIAALGCLHLSFTGGEVFARPDIFEILEEARKRNFAIALLTNGALISESVADRLQKIQPWMIEISLYSARSDIHDGITGIKGSFRKTKQAIDLLLERRIKVRLKTVIMAQNFSEYKEIMQHHKSLGTKFILDPMVTPKIDGNQDPLRHRITPDQLATLLTDDDIGPDMVQFGTRRYDESVQLRKTSTMCTAGIVMCHIDPYGNVYPCVQFCLKAGNLREQSFAEIWNHSPVFDRLRSTLMDDVKECNECELLGYCFRCPGLALMEDGDAFGPSRDACRTAELIKSLKLQEKSYERKV